MKAEVTEASSTRSKNMKKAGIVVGLCVLACKIPFILALIGFGGLGAFSSSLSLPPLAQTAVAVLSVVVVLSILAYLSFAVYKKMQP